MEFDHKIVIVGGGHSAQRFVEALLFDTNLSITLTGRKGGNAERLSKKFGLEFYPWDEFLFRVENYFQPSIVIFSTKLGTKFDLLQNLYKVGYKNSLVLEKPLSLSLEKIDSIQRLIESRNVVCFIPFTREFSDEYKMNFKILPEEILLEWPFIELGIDPLVHQGAHMMHFLAMNFEEYKIELKTVKREGTDYHFEGNIGDNKLICRLISDSTGKKQFALNGRSFPKINHLLAYPKMIEAIIQSSGSSSNHHIKRAIRAAKLLIEAVQRLE